MAGAEVTIRGKTSAVLQGQVDISDRASRLLGIVTSITNPVTISGLSEIDVTDRADRQLGIVTSITDPVTISGLSEIDVTDRAGRLVGIVYGENAQLQQRTTTNELLVQLTSSGIEIDPRDRNWTLAFATDSIDVSGSSITISGTPDVNVTDRANRLVGIVYGESAQLQQRPATFELLAQLTSAGAEIDPRDRNWTLAFATDSVDVSGSTITTTTAPTNPINDFDEDINIGSGNTSTHTYTATGSFKLSSIEASASGAMKIVVKAGASGSETTRMTAFTTESNLTIQLRFYEEVQITVGQRILVERTNREEEQMDVYSTILGFNS